MNSSLNYARTLNMVSADLIVTGSLLGSFNCPLQVLGLNVLQEFGTMGLGFFLGFIVTLFLSSELWLVVLASKRFGYSRKLI